MAIFADIKTPYVNDVTLKRIMSPRVKDNIFQGLTIKPGEGVTEKFSEDTDAAEIQVIRLKNIDDYGREIGASANGGWFNSDSVAASSTEAYGIKIIECIDRCIDIPTNAQDMVNTDLAEGELSNLVGRVASCVVAGSLAAYAVKHFNTFDNTATSNRVTLASSNPDLFGGIVDAIGKLNNGNEAQGIQAYPSEGRAIYMRNKAYITLFKTGKIIAGGSNYAQTMYKDGGVDYETKPNTTTGYVGDILGCPCYVISDQIWTLAEKYAGIGAGALDGVECVVVSNVGTGRALAFNSAIKTIPSPNGQGIRLQPKYRFGVECWDEGSTIFVVDAGFTGVRGTSAAAALTVTAPGSRSKVATPTGADGGSHKFTLACTTANATILYTTDGSTPKIGNGTTYSSTVTLSAGATVKAVAYLNGMLTSDVLSLTVA